VGDQIAVETLDAPLDTPPEMAIIIMMIRANSSLGTLGGIE
jgi:hypothetical protein